MNVHLHSIETNSYNNADGLEKTIQSVVSQTYPNFEYIVIDGNSSDRSKSIISTYESELAYWVSEPDTGIYNAMNKGIRASKGLYLLFLNSGDVLTSKHALANFIADPLFQGDIIYGDYKFDQGEKRYPDELPPDYFMKTSLPHQSTFFKRELFDRFGLYDETYKIGADRAFYVKCQVAGIVLFQHIRYFLTLFDLSGLSNDSDFLLRKKEEDVRLLKEGYGENYELYRKNIENEQRLKEAQRKSVKGILKRIAKRIGKLWKHRS